MLEKKTYANGQKVYDLEGDILTYYYKNGTLKAKGPFVDGKMEKEWVFYRENGRLWQIAHFKQNLKHGTWIRYDRNNTVEFEGEFREGKVVEK